MELLRQRAERLGEQLQVRRGNGELAAAGAQHGARGAHDVAHVELPQQVPALLAQDADPAEELQLAGGVLQDHEGNLALVADGTDATGDAHDVLGVLPRLELLPVGAHLLHVVGHGALAGIRVDAVLDELRALGATHGSLVRRVHHVDGSRLFGHACSLLCDASSGRPW